MFNLPSLNKKFKILLQKLHILLQTIQLLRLKEYWIFVIRTLIRDKWRTSEYER
jgi:hypothetical protein